MRRPSFNDRRDIHVDRVDLAGVEERTKHLDAPFDQEVRELPPAELAEQLGDRNRSIAGEAQDLAAEAFEFAAPLGGCTVGDRDPDGCLARGLDEPARDREPGGAVENDSGGSVLLEIGSLYRMLGRLLDSGLIEEGAGDERRRCYQLSRAGRRALKAEAERLAGLVDLVRMRKLLPEAD